MEEMGYVKSDAKLQRDKNNDKEKQNTKTHKILKDHSNGKTTVK